MTLTVPMEVPALNIENSCLEIERNVFESLRYFEQIRQQVILHP